MSEKHEIGGKHREDPHGSVRPRGKSREKRAHRLDGPTWTPTEKKIKDGLMRQFMRSPDGAGLGNSPAFRAGWDEAFGGGMPEYFKQPVKCDECEYEANNQKEIDFHLRNVAHSFSYRIP